ncbi:MAG: V-type ATP synthase subunit I [Bacillaceae bacterium]|nr:V-type ATP synthase subunit I [Bacillaceae bacterium]
MAIAKMKKLTLLAEQAHKEAVLKSVQEMQSLEFIPLAEKLEEALLAEFVKDESPADQSQIRTTLQDVQYSINYLNDYVPQPGLIEKLKMKKEVFTLKKLEEYVETSDINQLIKQISDKENHVNLLEEKLNNLKQEEDFFRKWSNLDFLLNEVKNFRLMHVMVGSVDIEYAEPLLDALKENGTLYVNEVYRRSDEVAYVFIFPKDEVTTVTNLMTQYGFAELSYPYDLLPKRALSKNLAIQTEVRIEIEQHKKEMRSWTSEYRSLQLAEEYYHNLVERQTVHDLLINSQHLFLLTGWIEEEKTTSLMENVWKEVGKDEVAILTDEIDIDEFHEVPIVLKNKSFVKPFEMVTEMFSYPQYNEVDPTPLMMPFFVLFFGMMSADVGYGLILFGVTLFAIKAFNFEGSTGRFIRFLHINSYATIAFGLFFGSLFGAELPFKVFSLQEDIMAVMGMSVVFGLIHLIYGLFINGKLNVKQGDRASAYVDGYSWALMLIGIILWVIGSMLLENPLLAQAGIAITIANVVGLLIVSALFNSNKALGFGLGAYKLYGATGYIGDVVSYTRLMALAVASANIGMAFNMIIGLMPPIARFTVGILLLVLLHGLNIALTLLSAYVHTSRLQYVEFFGKFYKGGGRPLNPLKTLEKHISMENKNQ